MTSSSETPVSGGQPSTRRRRVEALDGLRGIAILLVMVNHAGNQLWPIIGGVYDVPYLRGLFGGGAVVLFFVVGGFIVAHGLLGELRRGVMDPIRFYLRRLVRLGGQLLALSVALVIVQVVDSSAPGTMQALVQNLVHMLTYTLNLLPAQGDAPVRSDVGHLWYLSVQQQAYLLLPFVLILGWRHPRWAAALLTALAGLVYLHRQRLLDTVGWIPATIDTAARSDGLLWGVVLALLLPWLSKWRGWGIGLVVFGAGALMFQLTLQELPPFTYLGPWSLGYQFFIGLTVVAVWCLPRATLTARVLSVTPLVWLGRNSLTLFLWHLPLFILIARHTTSWPSWGRAVAAIAVLGLISVVMERTVERPTRRLLASHWLFRLESNHPLSDAPKAVS